MATRTGSGLPLVASECLSFESLSTADSVTSLSLASHSADSDATGLKRKSVRFSMSSIEIIEISPRREINPRHETLLKDFLNRQGFDEDVNCRRSWLFSRTFPLHVACKQADTTMVEVLLTYGADEMQQDRKGRTPADVAERYNRFGSHDGVLQALMAPERWRPHIRLRASTVHSLRARGT